jgi:phosphoglycerate kinase
MIKYLSKRNARVIVVAHQGRPGEKDFTSLKSHSEVLRKYVKIKFIPDICGKIAIKEIESVLPGESILLENVRFLKDEMEEDAKYVKILSRLADIYVNDSFSVSHRKQASIVGFPKHLPSYIGLSMEKEINALKKISVKNALFILAGSKYAENIGLIKKNKNKKILAAGLFGQLIMRSRGFDFGEQNKYFSKEAIQSVKTAISGVKISTPSDFAISVGGKRKEISLEDFPCRHEIFDIGPKTRELFKREIKNTRSVFMKGPLGHTEEKKFRRGTAEILKEISKSKCFSVIGGGHLSTAIEEMKINKNLFSHVSLSGGAFAEYISGKNLPGIDAIIKSKKIKKG